jgi:hypothetical protein
MVLEDYFSKLSPTFWQLGIGLLLVLTVLFAHRGLLGLAEDARGLFKRGDSAPSVPRRLVWKPEHWKTLGMSALDGAVIGFIAGFAINMKQVEFMTAFVTSTPARALIFTLGGAAVATGINAVHLLVTSRTSVEEQTP